MEYQDYLAKMEKKAAKKAKKAHKKAMQKANAKLNELSAVATDPKLMGPQPLPEYQARTKVQSFTKTGRPSVYTEQERNQFQSRIDNEKKNIWRICQADAEKILQFCEQNKADEKNAAVRYAREAAVKWAAGQTKVPY